MTTNIEPDESVEAAPAGRPRAVDLALYAIVLRCVMALAAAFAAFGAKDEIRRSAAILHPEWSAATLADKVDSQLRSNVVVTVVYIVLVLVIAKYIRDGRNWARWLFAIAAFLVVGDVPRITAFFTEGDVAFRVLAGLTGVAAVVAIVLLFSPSARGYFHPSGVQSPSPLQALFGRRSAALAAGPGVAQGNPPATGRDPVDRAAAPRSAGGKRPSPPRAKSRKQATE